MPAQQLLYRGLVDLGAGPLQLDLWISSSAAVAFEGAAQRGVLTGLRVGLTDDRRLRLTGLNEDGQETIWEATDPERVQGRWPTATVEWPEGTSWTQAEVAWSQYGVRVTAPGQPPRELIGARTEAVGAQRWIVTATERISASAARSSCGSCSGR